MNTTATPPQMDYLARVESSLGESPTPPSLSLYAPNTYQVNAMGRVVLAPDYSKMTPAQRILYNQRVEAYRAELSRRHGILERAREEEVRYQGRRGRRFEFPEYYTPIERTEAARGAVSRGFSPSKRGVPRIASKISKEEVSRKMSGSYKDYLNFLRQRAADTLHFRGPEAFAEESAQIQPELEKVFGRDVQPVSYF